MNVTFPQRSHRLWCPPGLLRGTLSQVLMWPEGDAEHSSPCIARVKKDRSYTSTRTPWLILDRSVNLFIYS